MSPRTGASIPEVLGALADLPALVRASVFEVATGTVRATVGADSGPPASLLGWARHAGDVARQRGRALEDVIVTSTEAHHLLRELPPSAGAVLWVHVEVDGRRGNLALVRRRLAHVAQGVDRRPALPTRPTPPHPMPAPTPATTPATTPVAAPVRATAAPVPTRAPAALAAPLQPRKAPAPAPAPAPAAPAVAATPALTMLPPLDPTWGPRRTRVPSGPPRVSVPQPVGAPAPEPPVTPAPRDAPVEEAPAATGLFEEAPAAPVIPAPRRVPVMGRPPIAFVEPPTVPPPPLPGEVATTPGETGRSGSGAAGTPADGDPSDGSSTEVSPTTGPEVDTAALGAGPLPTRTPGEHRPSLPAPRTPERASAWGTDGGTLRRLLVGLRRLA